MRSLMLGENEVSFSTRAHLLGRGLERVAQHLERDRIERASGCRHGAHSTSSTPLACTRGAIARIEHRGRRHLLDDGRALRSRCRRAASRAPAPAPRPSRRASPGSRPSKNTRRLPSLRLRRRRGARPARSVGSSGVSTLPMAVAPKPTISIGASGSAWPKRCAVGGVEVVGEAPPRARRPDREGDRQLVALSDIARLDAHLDRALVRRHAVRLEQAIAGLDQPARDRLGARRVAVGA